MRLSLPENVWADLLTAPNEDIPRRVAAAHLMRAGDTARARFVHAQLDLERIPPPTGRAVDLLRHRESDLWRTHRGDWAGPWGDALEFRRGFAHTLTLTPTGPFEPLAGDPELRALRVLCLDLSECEAFDPGAIAGLPLLGVIRILAGEIPAESIAALKRAYPSAAFVRGPRPDFRRRIVGSVTDAEPNLPLLAQTRKHTLIEAGAHLPNLPGEVRLHFRRPTDAGALLDELPRLAETEVLRLTRAALTPGDLAALLRAMPRLCILDLEAIRLDRRHWEAIPPLPRLRELRVVGHALPEEPPPLDAPRLLAAEFDPPVAYPPPREPAWTRRPLAFGLSLALPELFAESDGPPDPEWGGHVAGGFWDEDERRRLDPLATNGPSRASWAVYPLPAGEPLAGWLESRCSPWCRTTRATPGYLNGRPYARLADYRDRQTRLAGAFDLGDGRVLCLRLSFGERMLPLEAWFEEMVDSLRGEE